jgi:hypothetical protein
MAIVVGLTLSLFISITKNNFRFLTPGLPRCGCVFYWPFVLKSGKDWRYRWVCGASHWALSFKMWIEEIMGSS